MRIMARVRMDESEFLAHPGQALRDARGGAEVVVTSSTDAAAFITSSSQTGRLLSECVLVAESLPRTREETSDPEFANDVREAVEARQDVLESPAWD